jgi:hypothetical protein
MRVSAGNVETSQADRPTLSLDAGSLTLASMTVFRHTPVSVPIALCDRGLRQRRHRVGEFGTSSAESPTTHSMHRISGWQVRVRLADG